MKFRIWLSIFLILFIIPLANADYPKIALPGNVEFPVCTVYFTGVGCPHCANVDKLVLVTAPSSQNFLVIEYEVYQTEGNAGLSYDYAETHNLKQGIPRLTFDKQTTLSGDLTIKNNIYQVISIKDSKCLLFEDEIGFEDSDFTKLPGSPKIWANNRILIHQDSSDNNALLKTLLLTADIPEALQKTQYEKTTPEKVALSGSYVEFENAVKINGWIFQWNGEPVQDGTGITNNNGVSPTQQAKLTIPKIISLALVDAVNPCAIAVLALMLIAITTYDPKNRKNILLAGLAFTFSVFIIYIFYGLVLIKFFQLIQFLTSIRLFLYKALGMVAIILGFLNIRDFFRYKPGRTGTEMPLSFRPRVKKMLSRVTSPKAAFLAGAFVTIFLLPCTIGPYVIASGILSFLNILKTLPWLVLYNLVFIIPMLIITFSIYFGTAKVSDVSGWKDRNIRTLHLVAGIIMFLLGLAMLTGLI